MKKSLAAVTMAAAAILALSACTDSASPTAAPTEAEGAGELTSVRVAALPIAETGALWGAIDAGIFEEHGLDVEIVPAQGGAQAIPALLSGDIQFAIGQPFGPFRADIQDLGVVVISNYASSLAEGEDVNAVVSLGDSGITRPSDLAGKRVSVNSLGAAGDVTIMKAVEDDGGDPSTIEFIEVAFPDAQAQLDAGNIDAAWVPDPFMSQIVGGRRKPRRAPLPGHDPRTAAAHEHHHPGARRVGSRPRGRLRRGHDGGARLGGRQRGCGPRGDRRRTWGSPRRPRPESPCPSSRPR